MKKIVLSFVILVLLVACSSGESKEKFDPDNLLVGETASNAIINTPDNKGKSLEVSGIIFNIFTEGDYTYAQIYQDFEDYEGNVALRVSKDKSGDLKENSFIIAQGVLLGVLEAENFIGGNIEMGVIGVDNMTVGAFEDTVAKPLKTYDINQEKTQHGLTVILDKIEFSEYDTRLFLEIRNDSNSKVSVYSFNATVIADGKNYTEEYSMHTEYDEIDSELNPATLTNGILALKPIDYSNLKEFKFVLDKPYSSDWETEFEDFVFDVVLD